VEDPPASPATRPHASIIVPTYNEADGIATLIRRLDDVRERSGIDLELVIVDDASPDGTARAAHALEAPWVHVVERRAPRSLAGAVLDGFARAASDVLVVMDADLTHPPSAVPELIAAVRAGAPIAVGSRYAAGGSTDPDWPALRRAASILGTGLVRPIARTTDPLSGFFAIRRDVLDAAGPIRERGFKIGLEIIVRAGVRGIADVPIQFVDRKRGESKASAREATRFLLQVIRLYAVAARRVLAPPRRARAVAAPRE
jgi:dolichol-phosphate mannosyltransferase